MLLLESYMVSSKGVAEGHLSGRPEETELATDMDGVCWRREDLGAFPS